MLFTKNMQTGLGWLLAIVFLWAGIFATTFGTVNQALPAMLIGVIGAIVVFSWRKENRTNLLTLSVFILVWYLAIRAFTSPITEYGYQDLFLILSGGIVFFIQNKAQSKIRFHKIVVIGILTLVSANLLMFIPSLNNLRDSTIDYASGSTQSGLFNHKNFFSNLMGMGMCLSMSLLIWMKPKGIKIASGLIALGCIGAVFYSTNRAASISVFVALVVIFSIAALDFKLFKRLKTSTILLGLFIVATVGVISYSVVSSKTFYHSGFIAQSNGRVDCWSMAVSQIPDAPLIGSGPRSFEYKNYEYWTDSLGYYQGDFKFVHSEYLQMVTDYGIIGLILSLSVIAIFLFNSFSRISSRKLKGFSLACLAAGTSAFIFMLIHAFLSFPLHGYVNMIVLAYLSGFVFISGDDTSNSEPQKKYVSTYFYAGSMAVFSIAIILLPINEFKAGMAFWKHGIGGDDLNWNPAEQKEKNWLDALLVAHEVSPRFSRAQKIGLLYMEKASALGGSEEYEEKADRYFRESIKLNPYNVVPQLNLATLYHSKEEYSEAENTYNSINRRYLGRLKGNYYRYDRKLNRLYFDWLSHLVSENKLEEIPAVLSKLEAHKKQRRVDYYAEGRLVDCIENIARAVIHFSAKENEQGYKEYDEFVKKGRSFHKEADFLLWHIDGLINHANYVWYKHRNPQRALVFFKKAKIEYQIFTKLAVTSSLMNTELKEKIAGVTKSLQLLEKAGFR